MVLYEAVKREEANDCLIIWVAPEWRVIVVVSNKNEKFIIVETHKGVGRRNLDSIELLTAGEACRDCQRGRLSFEVSFMQ